MKNCDEDWVKASLVKGFGEMVKPRLKIRQQ